MQVTPEIVITLCVLFLTGFAWNIRLEAKVIYLEKDHAEHKLNGNEKMESMSLKIDSFQSILTQVLQGIARLEGQMRNKGS